MTTEPEPTEPPRAPSPSARGGAGKALALAVGLAAVAFAVGRSRTSGDDAGVGEPIDARRGRGERVTDERPADAPDAPEALTVRIVRSFPHDPRAFTQGLVWHEGGLLEGTGLYGRSTIRRVALESGEVERTADLPPEVFGEGIARVGERILQLTWQEHRLFVRRLSDFAVEREVRYEGEGWGLCFDGTHVVMSDGSDTLTFRDPEDFDVVRRVRVRLRGRPLDQLNELECVDGLVYANVWQTDHIARIDPTSGRVTGWIDTALHEGSPEGARLLEPADAEEADVLNGIAWVPERGHFLIGGKLWPRLFEVEFVPSSSAAPATP